MQRLTILLLLIICTAFNIKAQNIAIRENFSDTELVQKLFPSNSCMTPTNVRINGHTFSGNKKSFGYFTNTNPAFELSEGIIITSGRADAAVGPNRSILSDGPTSWRGDSDLERAINESNTFNATSIEFEIVALTNQLSFDYIFSSEQYLSNPASYQCDYSDGFAFLVKEADNANAQYANIALIPNTNLPVKVSNVRARTNSCPESYVQYFGGFNGQNHPTNYNGQTKVLTARANVTPGVRYKFKLVVADQGNEKYDSAIFLSASSFRNSIDLGIDRDQVFCYNQSYTLTPTPIPGVQHYTWYKDGSVINGHNQVTNPNLTINESGTYKLVAFINTNCIIEEEVTINFEAPLDVPNLSNNVCGFGATTTYNILQNSPYDNLFTQNDDISYHSTLVGAQNNTDLISRDLLINYPLTQTINKVYVRVVNGNTGCVGVGEFSIITNSDVTTLPIQNFCNINTTGFNLAAYIPGNSTTGIQIYASSADAIAFQNQINTTNSALVNLQTGQNLFYIRYTDSATCGDRYILEINVLESSNLPTQNLYFCQGESVQLQAPTGYTSYSWSNGSNAQIISVNQAGTYTVTLQTTTGCTSSQTFQVNQNTKPVAFNQTYTICSFSTQNILEVNVSNYIQPLIQIGNTFTIYESIANAENQTNALNTIANISANTTWFVREQTPAGCYTISTITIQPTFATQLAVQNFCTVDNQPISLQNLVASLQGTYPNSVIKIFLTQQNAEANTNAINTNQVSASANTLYIKVTDTSNSCLQNLVAPIQITNTTTPADQFVTICQNTDVALSALTGNFTYLWSTGQTTQNITVNQIGTYTVTLTTPLGCNITQTFHVNQSQPAVITDVIVKHFANIQNSITIIAQGEGEFEYSIDGVNFQNSNVFYGTPAGDYTVFVRDKNGCGIATKDTLVIDIRNFFTPNGDGIYDTWDASQIFSVFPNSEVYIVDRYNKLMTYLFPNKPTWDGTAFGKPQPSTDYWYIIKLGNGKEYKGHFSLKR